MTLREMVASQVHMRTALLHPDVGRGREGQGAEDHMKQKRTTLAVAFLLLLTMGAPSASADILTYTLTQGNASPGLACCTGPYAQVDVNRTSTTTATITFTSLTNGGYIYLLGASGTADLNVNGSYTLGPVTESNSISGFTPSWKDNKPGNVSAFGTFNLSLNNDGGFTDSATSISFTLTDTSGTWTSAAGVLTPNPDGQIAAVHGFACAEPGCSTSTTATAAPKASSGAAYTGFASGAQVVPDGGMTLMLLGGTLVGLETLRRKFRV
jgi:hypothetical protein